MLYVLSLLILFASGPRLLDLKAYQSAGSASEVTIEWTVQQESGIVKYLVYRKMLRDADFVHISEVTSKNTGSYSFTDRSVFKGGGAQEQIFYSVWAVRSDGSKEMLGQTGVQYTASSVRRTWGSIKAMFQ